MALVPICIDRTSKPPVGTPLRSDGHWSVRGIAAALAFNELAGLRVINQVGQLGYNRHPNTTLAPNGLSNAVVGQVAASYFLSSSLQSNNQTIVIKYSGLSNSIANVPALDGTTTYGSWTNLLMGLWKASPDVALAIFAGLNAIYVITSSNTVGHDNKVRALYVGAVPAAGTIAVRLVSGTPTIYLNGKLVGTSSSVSSALNWYTPRYLFSESVTDYHSAVCVVESVQVSVSALSPAEIASLSANPWQIYEPETVWVTVGGVGAALLEGLSGGTASIAANLTSAITASGSLSGSSSVAGDLTALLILGGGTSGSGDITASITTAISAAGSITASAVVTGVLAETAGAITLVGSSLGSSAVAGALTSVISLAGASSAAGQLAGQLTTAVTLIGSVSGSNSVSGALTLLSSLAGSVAGSGISSASLTTALSLMASVSGSGRVTGYLLVVSGAGLILFEGFIAEEEEKGFIALEEEKGFIGE